MRFSFTYTRGILGEQYSNWNKVKNIMFCYFYKKKKTFFKYKLCITSNGITNSFRLQQKLSYCTISTLQTWKGEGGVRNQIGGLFQKRCWSSTGTGWPSFTGETTSLFSVSHLLQSSGPTRKNRTNVLWGAPKGDRYSSWGHCTPTLSSHVQCCNNRQARSTNSTTTLLSGSFSLSRSLSSISQSDVGGWWGGLSMFVSQEAAQMRTTGLTPPVVSVEIKRTITEAQQTLMLLHSR